MYLFVYLVSISISKCVGTRTGVNGRVCWWYRLRVASERSLFVRKEPLSEGSSIHRWFPGNQSEPVMSLAEGQRLCSAFGTEWIRPDIVPPHAKVQTFPGVISTSLVMFYLPIVCFTRPFYSQTSAFLPKWKITWHVGSSPLRECRPDPCAPVPNQTVLYCTGLDNTG